MRRYRVEGSDMSKSRKNSSKPYPVEIVGEAYRQLKQEIAQLAKHNTNVMFIGKTGCGKEVFAKYYMSLFTDRGGERRTQLCTGHSGESLYSMMFGHKKGAFTGADKSRDGLVGTCKNGIVFLDELGDASDDFQASLLRVVEGNSYTPLGSDEEKDVENVLFIAATNRPEKVRKEIKNRFKEVYIPPLQKSDIPDITTHFLQERKKSREVFPSKKALDKLMERDYLGNVRELKQAWEDLLIEEGDRILRKSPPKLPTYSSFDYKRYVREIKKWNKCLQPLFDKYDINIEYKYMPQFDEGHQSEFLPPDRDVEIFLELLELINKLGCGSELSDLMKKNYDWLFYALDLQNPSKEDILTKFKSKFNEVIEHAGGLPSLLERLDEKDKSTSAPSPMPDMTFLLSLPLHRAKKEFEKILIQYNLEKHSNKKAETAEALEISISTLNRKIK
jgi:DNA-binding NtrC family response regulator